MTNEILIQIVPSAVSAVLAWFLARSKNKQAIIKMRIENQMEAAKYYQSLLDDMTERLNKAIKEVGILTVKNTDLMQANEKLMQVNKEVIATNKRLIEANKKLTIANNNLTETNRHLIAELQKFKQLNGKPKEDKPKK